ncbi:alpha/beta hydrolase [Gracilibacillus sp. YIM 98692]|uniref:alpha/beta hydrolase n=1 Tax=Gracilibacillus sp. YIM 98692 TaxID=2663532 RepID=UPI0013D0CDDB|nr:alpha/beta hydrolase [Gracilibacillus sp. YIM 98692]
MKKIFKILVIFGISSVVIYLCIAYGLIFLNDVKQPSGEKKNLQFEHLKTDEIALPKLNEYEARDGTQLTYRYYESSANQVLILLHGSGYHSDYLEPLANYLSNENIASVYTPNVRGHGNRADNRGDIDYIGQIEQDINDLIELVNERHPNQSIVLGGHSSGGGTVIRIAGGEYSHETVDDYLLIAPYVHHKAPTNNSDENGWANVSVPRMIGLSMLNQVGITHMNDTNVISFNMPNEYRDGTETLTYSYRLQISMHPRDDYNQDIASMNGDVLVLAGSEDESFQAEKYDVVFNVHDQTDVVLVDGLSHFGPIYDEQAHKTIAEWLISQ